MALDRALAVLLTVEAIALPKERPDQEPECQFGR